MLPNADHNAVHRSHKFLDSNTLDLLSIAGAFVSSNNFFIERNLVITAEGRQFFISCGRSVFYY